MEERIKTLGLTSDGTSNPIVKGDNAKLRELQNILDAEGYQNDTYICSVFFGIPVPEPEDIKAIVLNHEGGINGYCLLTA